MSKPQSTYPLRLPTSVKAEVVRRAKADGTSFNQFVATAVAEIVPALLATPFESVWAGISSGAISQFRD
jgi:hypothetical protein